MYNINNYAFKELYIFKANACQSGISYQHYIYFATTEKVTLHFFSHLLAVDEFVLKTITLTPFSFVGIKEQMTAQ